MKTWKIVLLSGVGGFLLAIALLVVLVLVMVGSPRECNQGRPRSEVGGGSAPATLRKSTLPEIENRIRAIGGRVGTDKRSFDPVERSERCTMLALSGGGLYGAFGAGVLNGWWEQGRPRFDVVTGISTGALQAPFVFVHTAEAEKTLESVYSSAAASDIVDTRWLPLVPFSSSVTTTEGLKRLIRQHVTDDLIKEVAVQSGLSRGLFVGTANLDTGSLEIWDMGRVAVSGQHDLFRDILLASSSIPVSLPPVMIDGQLHMDGGAREQIFVPCVVEALHEGHRELLRDVRSGSVRTAEPKPPQAYFIVNGEIGVYPHCTQPRVLDIAVRAIDLLTDEARVGNLWKCWGRIQLTSESTGETYGDAFNLIAMPPDLLGGAKSSIELTAEDSRIIYAKGREMGEKAALPESWLHSPEELAHPVGRP